MELDYNLEMERIISEIKRTGARLVLLHLPDGLKPKAETLQREIMANTSAEVLIWAGSNFGACDLPIDIERLGVDLIVHFGHSEWVY